MVDIGYFALCLALLASGYGALASALGARRGHLGLVRSGENGVLATCGLLTLAVLALWHALLSHDFQVEYVAENSNRAMPLFYLITSLWGGQNGSLLFWGWILSIYSAGLAALYRQRYRELMPYAIATLSLTSFFFCIVHLFAADPFQRLPFTPEDGRGLNPILQHPVMAIHPPMLYLGMVGMVVPFAFAIAALLTGKLDATWLRAARRWMLIPWTFLGFGLLLGGKWAYVELGWGGYWALGSGGELFADALADRHRFSALDYDSRAQGHAQSMERSTGDSHVRAVPLRHLYDPQWHHILGARLCPVQYRPFFWHVSRPDADFFFWAFVAATAFAQGRKPLGILCLARDSFLAQQLDSLGDALRRVLGYGLSTGLRSLDRRADHGRSPLFQSGHYSHRPSASVVDRCWSALCLASHF